jgi:predicted lipid carrier protein YhbT
MGRRHIAIDPSDVPFVFLLEVGEGTITLRLARELRNSGVHARICGPLLALIGLVDGTYDGDALFFSRDIVIEGDVETVLALRNAIDDAEVGVLRELVATAGEFAAPIDRAARDIAAAMRRVVGGVASQPRGNGL